MYGDDDNDGGAPASAKSTRLYRGLRIMIRVTRLRAFR
jgi:hypothetical protein